MKYDQYQEVIISGLRTLIRHEGIRSFDDERRCKSLLDDYLPQIRGRQERKMLDTAILSGIFSMILGGYMSDSEVYRKAEEKLLDETFLSGDAVEVILYWIFEASDKKIPPKPVPPKTIPTTPEKMSPPSSSSTSQQTDELIAAIQKNLQNLSSQINMRKIERTYSIVCPNMFGMPTVFLPGMSYVFNFYGLSSVYFVNACVQCDGLDYLICSVPPFGGYCLIQILGAMTMYVEDEKLKNDVIDYAKRNFWIY